MGRAITRDGRHVDFLDDQIGEGGEKIVFFTPDKREVVCFYKAPERRSSRREQERLTKLLREYNPTRSDNPKIAAHFSELFCWPTAIIDDPKLGIITPTYPSKFFFTDGKKPFIIGKEKNVVYHTGKSRRFLADEDLGNFYTKIRACLHISRATRKLHFTGIAHTDLSNNNVLIDLREGTAVIIDLDSAAVPNYYPPTVLGTKGYIAPEVMQTAHLEEGDENIVMPSIKTDQHALAVLIYEILFLRHPLEGKLIHDHSCTEEDERLAKGERALFIEDPTDRSNRPDLLQGSELTIDSLHTLRDNFIKTFSRGLHKPELRATAPSWEKALLNTIDLTIPCENSGCKERFFLYADDGGRPRCPFCNTTYSRSIPIIKLLRTNGRNRYHPVGKIAGYHRRTLFEYHIFQNRNADETAENTPHAQILFHNGQWMLKNISIESGIRTEQENIVQKGRAIPLETGTKLTLAGHGSYIAEISITR